ncbi:hypothetical protein BJ912DRAFT_1133183 [Pholiota molesta]|nr:hypothetical protein BJ912DRAFT_1133183 [Pholiota molesta]
MRLDQHTNAPVAYSVVHGPDLGDEIITAIDPGPWRPAVVDGRDVERWNREANGEDVSAAERATAHHDCDTLVDFGAEPSFDLLTISPLTLTLPFALATYLFVTYALGAPHEALGVALLAGATTRLDAYPFNLQMFLTVTSNRSWHWALEQQIRASWMARLR